MDPAPIFALVCALFAGIVIIAFYGMYRSAKKGRQEFDKGIPASAKIVKVGDSYNSRNYGDVTVDLTLEITPPNGAPYQVDKTWSVEPAHIAKIQEGNTLAIRIDAKNPKKIYSAEAWAEGMNF